jgi:hypothetical protein
LSTASEAFGSIGNDWTRHERDMAYSFQKSTGYWFGQGDGKYVLSPDLWARLPYPAPRLPPLIVSADEKAAIDKAAQERRRMLRKWDRAEVLAKWGPLPEKREPLAAKTTHRAASPTSPSPKKVSDAALRRCLSGIVSDHKEDQPDSPPPDEETLHSELERRLEAPLERDRVRRVRNEVAPEFKLPRGRPRRARK